MKIINRQKYLNQLINVKNTPDIKVITGIRRAGKSKLMRAFADFVKELEPDSNVIYIDFAKITFEKLKDYHKLNDYIEKHTADDVMNYLFIDEVQLCENFEITINSLHSSEKYDIYLTGSNAFMLSSDLATLFTGRHLEIHVFPFSFYEYCKYFEINDKFQVAFDRYVLEGGLSGSYVYKNSNDKEDYVKKVYNTILTRDLTEKYKIADTQVLMRLAEYMMDNVSNITSPNNVANVLTSNKISTNHVTVGNYLDHICNAFLFYKVDRYDIKGKKYLESLNKYYLADTGIRYAMLGRRNMDWGRIYENVVFIELLRRGFRVYVGKLYQKEIDFIAIRGNEKLYIQVSDDLSSEQTFKREIEPLLSVPDAYPKFVVARTRHEEYDFQGIRIVDLATGLLTE